MACTLKSSEKYYALRSVVVESYFMVFKKGKNNTENADGKENACADGDLHRSVLIYFAFTCCASYQTFSPSVRDILINSIKEYPNKGLLSFIKLDQLQEYFKCCGVKNREERVKDKEVLFIGDSAHSNEEDDWFVPFEHFNCDFEGGHVTSSCCKFVNPGISSTKYNCSKDPFPLTTYSKGCDEVVNGILQSQDKKQLIDLIWVFYILWNILLLLTLIVVIHEESYEESLMNCDSSPEESDDDEPENEAGSNSV
ncbi:hypothetical protein QYM36_016512 [Artemia franciscana]|uniref:Uncharacterized protein n=1 Tax=Artemia franciscana TaxID=6661 RepID=A0AA88L3I2_ARTSF|nr:hypothetical protein QYM36_016512 [Artemia franciscana]